MSIILPGQISHSNPDFAIADIKDVRGGIRSLDILDNGSLAAFAPEVDKFLNSHSIIIERSTNRLFRLKSGSPLESTNWELVSTVFEGLEISRTNLNSYVDNDDLVNQINNLPTFTVDSNVIKIFNGLLQSPNLGNFIQKHFLISQDVTFGMSGSQITYNDLELFYQQDLSTVDDIVGSVNPNATNYNLGTQSTNDIADIVNNSGPYQVSGEDVYFSFIAFDINYIFRFLITASGSYGMGAISVTQSDFIEFYNSNVDVYIEGTYAEIANLKSNSLLIPNKNYIITDYQTKYMIQYTDTSRIVSRMTAVGSVSGYLQFPLDTALPLGLVVTVVGLPNGYTGTAFIGQTGSITNLFGTQYYIFSVLSEGAENIGITLEYQLPRYSATFDQVTLYDYYGNVICKPGGVINTDVHGGTAYGTMSASENMAPPIERIVLTAVSPNKFSLNGFSDTFENDVIEYDFNDTQIKDYNGNVIGTRNGFILRRKNDILGIDINKDWRAQKYRRYRVTENLFDRYKYLEEVYKVSGYSTGGMVSTLYSSDGHRYSVLDLENKYHINDFTVGITGSNIFASSSNTATIDAGSLFSTSTSQLKYYYDFNLSSTNLLFKDYNIFPLDSNYNPTSLVKSVKVKDLDNTVFLNNPKNFGSSDDITVDSELGTIKSSTFLSGIPILNTKIMSNILTFDTGQIANFFDMYYVRLMSNNSIINHGTLFNVSFGSRAFNEGSLPQFAEFQIMNDCRITNSMIGGNYVTDLKLIECDMSSSFFHIGFSYLAKLTFKGHLTAFREGNISTATNLLNTNFRINTGFAKNPNKVNSYGFNYVFTASNTYQDKFIETMDNKNLYYPSISSSGLIVVTASIPT